MTKRASWITAVVCAIVLGGAVLAVAAYEHDKTATGIAGRRFQHFAARLKLTPEQQTQIKADLQQTRTAAKPDFDSVRSLRETLARQIFSDQPNQAEIQKNADQLKQHLSASIDRFIAVGMQINQKLTPAQRAEMQKIISERVQRAQQRRAQQSSTPSPQSAPAQPAK